MHRSDSGGGSWTHSCQGITALAVSAVATDPQDPNNLYAGDDGGGFYYSHDGGQAWALATGSEIRAGVRDIVVDPNDSDIVYLIDGFGDLSESTDRGQTIGAPFVNFMDPECLEIPPSSSDTLYVCVNGGIWKGVKSGAAWDYDDFVLLEGGMPMGDAHSLSIDPQDNDILWVGLDSYGGVAKSTDGGDTWAPMGLSEAPDVTAVVAHPTLGSEILAGTEDLSGGKIYKSSDGGATWQLKLADIGTPEVFVYHPNDPSCVYVATYGYGVLRSLDGGETWHDFSDGLYYPLLEALAITGASPPTLLTGSLGSGISTATATTGPSDTGSWQTAAVYGGEMTSIAVHPDDPQTVYVGTRDAGVFKSTDGGVSWTPARNGLIFVPIRTLVADPSNGQVVYAGTDFNGVWKTSDGGASWAQAGGDLSPTGVIMALVIDPSDTATIYVGVGAGAYLHLGNIFKSPDGGATWQLSDRGLPRYDPF